jgi:hypothetical protein
MPSPTDKVIVLPAVVALPIHRSSVSHWYWPICRLDVIPTNVQEETVDREL